MKIADAEDQARRRIQELTDAGASTATAVTEALAFAILASSEIDALKRQLAEPGRQVRTVSGNSANGSMAKIADEIFAAVRGFIARAVEPMGARVEALEAARSMHFAGPHDPGAAGYARGAVVQRGGQTWVALLDTAEYPGASPTWRSIGRER